MLFPRFKSSEGHVRGDLPPDQDLRQKKSLFADEDAILGWGFASDTALFPKAESAEKARPFCVGQASRLSRLDHLASPDKRDACPTVGE